MSEHTTEKHQPAEPQPHPTPAQEPEPARSEHRPAPDPVEPGDPAMDVGGAEAKTRLALRRVGAAMAMVGLLTIAVAAP